MTLNFGLSYGQSTCHVYLVINQWFFDYWLSYPKGYDDQPGLVVAQRNSRMKDHLTILENNWQWTTSVIVFCCSFDHSSSLPRDRLTTIDSRYVFWFLKNATNVPRKLEINFPCEHVRALKCQRILTISLLCTIDVTLMGNA